MVSPAPTLEEIYARHARAVWAYARAHAPRPDLAEDLAAEAFLVLARRLREAGPPESPLGYLLATVRSRAIDETRRRRPGPLPEGLSSPAPGDAGRRERVFAAVRALDPDLAEAVALRSLAGLTWEEAVRESGVPRSTLEGRYAAALEKLTQILKDERP